MTPEELIAALVAAIQSTEQALNRSVLDGTISCTICRVLVLDGEQAWNHYRWHYNDQDSNPEEAWAGIMRHKQP